MTHKSLDFLAIGDITTDAFIRLKDATVNCDINNENCQICMAFGDKIPYDFVEVVKAVGNSANAAVSASRLGLSAGLLSNIGDDQNGKDMLETLNKENVSTKYIKSHAGIESNYHYVLWYEDQRTILVKHHDYPYAVPENMPAPSWIYLSSLAESSKDYHHAIAKFVKAHPESKLVFQPGTFQIKLGTNELADIYSQTYLFFCNKDEAKKILNTKEEEDVKVLMQKLAELGPKMVVVTDDIKGAYAYDGTDSWFMPIYPHTPKEKTGAGDAFASTVTCALALGKTLEEALLWGPINAQSVTQQVGAQKGLLSQSQIAEFLAKAPNDYKPRKI